MIALALCSALLGGGPEPSEAEWVWVSRARPAGESGGLALRFDLDDDSPGVRRPQEGSPRRSVRSAALFAVVEHCEGDLAHIRELVLISFHMHHEIADGT